MQQARRQFVAFAAAAAWILQAWLAVTHVHSHSDESCGHTSASAVCHAHPHTHDHDGHSHAPAAPTSDEHESDDCQICRLLAQQPLPFVAPVQLTDAASIPDEVHFSVDVPTLRPERLFQSRAPPTHSV